MRTLVSLLVLALVVPLAGCQREFKDFTTFSPSDGNYTVLMPGKPKRETRTENGLTLTMYAVESWGEGYAVGTADIPPHLPCDLNGAVAGMARTVDGTHRSEGSDRNGSGYREFEIEGRSPKKMISGRVLFARGRFYMVFAYGKNARLSNPTVRTFIDSFRLTDGDTPGAATAAKPAPPVGPTPPPGPPVAPPLPMRPAPAAPSSPPKRDAIISMTTDPAFQDEAPDGGLLVGFDVWYGTYANYDIINAIRPIYRINGSETAGQMHGTASARGARVLAKPGYAVGAVVVKNGAAIDSLSVTFMKVVGNRLNPADAYTAAKVGGPGGYDPTKLGGDGTPIIGMSGRKNPNLTGFGLVFATGR